MAAERRRIVMGAALWAIALMLGFALLIFSPDPRPNSRGWRRAEKIKCP
jgi:hypothetical protein